VCVFFLLSKRQHIIHKTRQSLRVSRNMEARSWNRCCSGKAIIITYSECVFAASDNQHAKLTRRIILSSAACPALPYFFTLSHKAHDFRNKKKFLSVFFWVFPRRLIMVCRRFGTLYLLHLQRLDVQYEV